MPARFLIVLTMGSGLVAFGQQAQAQFNLPTTVKSSKSNTSDRFGGPPRGPQARATTVKSSKSNSSDRVTSVRGSKSNSLFRMGGGGGGGTR